MKPRPCKPNSAASRLRAIVEAAEPGTKFYVHRLATTLGVRTNTVRVVFNRNPKTKALLKLVCRGQYAHWIRVSEAPRAEEESRG